VNCASETPCSGTERHLLRVVDEDLDAAQPAHDLVDRGREGLLRLDVAGQRDRAPAALLDLLAGVLDLRRGAARDRDRGALGGEGEGDPLSHALTRSRHQRHLARQHAHRRGSFRPDPSPGFTCSICARPFCGHQCRVRPAPPPRVRATRGGAEMGEPEIQRMAPMAARYTRPDWVRRLNAMADSVGGGEAGPRRIVPLDADALLEQARESLGGGTFGDFGDPHWEHRLRVLVQAFDAQPLTVVGRLMTRQELLRSLRTRLQLARAWDANPRIASESIEAPILITGPARSGTTITFELFWLDPDLRGPSAADALHPIPEPGQDLAARLAMSECEQELWADVQPEFAAIHELRSDLPVECVTLTAPSFCGGHWPMVGAAGAPDMVETYAFEKRILQLLQHGQPKKTWLLKTPGHVMTIDLVFATFPDAWVVQTHRDPVKTMPSTVSTTAMVQWLRSERVDLPTMVRLIDGAFSHGLNALAERRTRGELPKPLRRRPLPEPAAGPGRDPPQRLSRHGARVHERARRAHPDATSPRSRAGSSASTSTRPKSGASRATSCAARWRPTSRPSASSSRTELPDRSARCAPPRRTTAQSRSERLAGHGQGPLARRASGRPGRGTAPSGRRARSADRPSAGRRPAARSAARPRSPRRRSTGSSRLASSSARAGKPRDPAREPVDEGRAARPAGQRAIDPAVALRLLGAEIVRRRG
jgi:hypothetical protein